MCVCVCTTRGFFSLFLLWHFTSSHRVFSVGHCAFFSSKRKRIIFLSFSLLIRLLLMFFFVFSFKHSTHSLIQTPVSCESFGIFTLVENRELLLFKHLFVFLCVWFFFHFYFNSLCICVAAFTNDMKNKKNAFTFIEKRNSWNWFRF